MALIEANTRILKPVTAVYWTVQYGTGPVPYAPVPRSNTVRVPSVRTSYTAVLCTAVYRILYGFMPYRR
ncbi:hypothetical protein B0H19DRAFT_1123185 [Mycena capillaripes]|nr:hypothetical protein B0H19DRAFT_1123185 [Mycena capillaripes]